MDTSVTSNSTVASSSKLSRRMDLQGMLSSYREFDCEENLHKYYLNLENDPQSDKFVIEFWEDVIATY